jgi:hypothetical protein
MRLFVFALVVATSAPGLLAQEPAPGAQPSTVVSSGEPAGAAGPTRLFFAPTARSVARGSGSAGVTEIAFPWVEVGLAGPVSALAGGVLPIVGGVVLAPKVQVVSRPTVQAAFGVAHVFAPGLNGGVAYGVVSAGSSSAAVTVGAGYGYGQVASSGGSPAVLFVGGEKALGRSVRLLIEGYVSGAALGMPDQAVIIGARYTRGRWSVDLGVLVPVYETGSGTPVPVFTIARGF